MIIDKILDRRYDREDNIKNYKANDFYYDMMAYEEMFYPEFPISKAMDYGTEKEVKKALKDYIDRNNYNESIKDFIDSVDWLTDDLKEQ